MTRPDNSRSIADLVAYRQATAREEALDYEFPNYAHASEIRPSLRLHRGALFIGFGLICFCAGWAARDADREKRVPEIQAEKSAPREWVAP